LTKQNKNIKTQSAMTGIRRVSNGVC